MQSGINISGAPKESVEAFGGKILEILKAGMDYRLSDQTIRFALQAFSDGVTVTGTTISGCNLSSNDTWITPHPDDEVEDCEGDDER